VEKQPPPDFKVVLRARTREFNIPPVRDGIVLGRHSPVGCVAVRNALGLLNGGPFAHIELADEVISDVIVRQTILRRLPREKLIAFVLDRIKPLRGPEEILHLDLEVEILLEEEFG